MISRKPLHVDQHVVVDRDVERVADPLRDRHRTRRELVDPVRVAQRLVAETRGDRRRWRCRRSRAGSAERAASRAGTSGARDCAGPRSTPPCPRGGGSRRGSSSPCGDPIVPARHRRRATGSCSRRSTAPGRHPSPAGRAEAPAAGSGWECARAGSMARSPTVVGADGSVETVAAGDHHRRGRRRGRGRRRRRLVGGVVDRRVRGRLERAADVGAGLHRGVGAHHARQRDRDQHRRPRRRSARRAAAAPWPTAAPRPRRRRARRPRSRARPRAGRGTGGRGRARPSCARAGSRRPATPVGRPRPPRTAPPRAANAAGRSRRRAPPPTGARAPPPATRAAPLRHCPRSATIRWQVVTRGDNRGPRGRQQFLLR